MTSDRGAGSDGGTPSPNKQLVHRLVDDVINARRFESLEGLATSRFAPKLRTAFEQFRAAFPDWHQEIVELVEDGDTVVARFRCTGTQATDWQGLRPRAGRWTWTRCRSSASPTDGSVGSGFWKTPGHESGSSLATTSRSGSSARSAEADTHRSPRVECQNSIRWDSKPSSCPDARVRSFAPVNIGGRPGQAG
jgi:predicted ester cyclase